MRSYRWVLIRCILLYAGMLREDIPLARRMGKRLITLALILGGGWSL